MPVHIITENRNSWCISSKTAPEKDDKRRAAAAPSEATGTDWKCKMCGNLNWERRPNCNMCKHAKDGKVLKDRTGRGGGYNERQSKSKSRSRSSSRSKSSSSSRSRSRSRSRSSKKSRKKEHKSRHSHSSSHKKSRRSPTKSSEPPKRSHSSHSSSGILDPSRHFSLNYKDLKSFSGVSKYKGVDEDTSQQRYSAREQYLGLHGPKVNTREPSGGRGKHAEKWGALNGTGSCNTSKPRGEGNERWKLPPTSVQRVEKHFLTVEREEQLALEKKIEHKWAHQRVNEDKGDNILLDMLAEFD